MDDKTEFDLFLKNWQESDMQVYPLEENEEYVLIQCKKQYECNHLFYNTTPTYSVWNKKTGKNILMCLSYNLAYKKFISMKENKDA